MKNAAQHSSIELYALHLESRLFLVELLSLAWCGAHLVSFGVGLAAYLGLDLHGLPPYGQALYFAGVFALGTPLWGHAALGLWRRHKANR